MLSHSRGIFSEEFSRVVWLKLAIYLIFVVRYAHECETTVCRTVDTEAYSHYSGQIATSESDA